jgi:hypothetical protein
LLKERLQQRVALAMKELSKIILERTGKVAKQKDMISFDTVNKRHKWRWRRHGLRDC